MVSCGTPDVTAEVVDFSPSSRTCCVCPDRKLAIHSGSMGNCKGKLSKSEKNKFREEVYVKNIDRNEIVHGKDGPPIHQKTDTDEHEEENKLREDAYVKNIARDQIDHGSDEPTVHSKADIDENEERSAHKISTITVNATNHGKDGPTVLNKADTDEHEVKNTMSTESNIIEHAQDELTINQHPIVSNDSDPSTSSLESKNQHEKNVPEIKDTIFKTENSGDSLTYNKENSRPSKKDTNVTANKTHVTIEPTNGMNKEQKETKQKKQDPITQVQKETKKQNQDPITQVQKETKNKTQEPITQVQKETKQKNQDPITQVQKETKQKNQDPITQVQQKERQMYNFAAGYKADSDNEEGNSNEDGTNHEDTYVVTSALNVNTGDIHCTDLSLNFGDKHRTDLSQNTGDKCETDLSRNTGEKNETDLSQDTGDKRSTDANKINVVNPTTMPKDPDMNTSDKTLKGGEVTQNKDLNTPADKTDDDDNGNMTGYESAKYAKRIDDKDKKSETKSTKKDKKKKKIKNRTDINYGDINASVLYLGCKVSNEIHNHPERRQTEGVKKPSQLGMKIVKVLGELSKSVGMFEGKFQGSCWRAGTDLIVTAWHVVRDHISEYDFLNEIKLKEVKIKFDYTVSGDCDESNIFEVEPKVLYRNETLDTAILRLKPNGKVVTFPPPFRRLDHFLIPAKDEDQTIYLIGHPDGLSLQMNPGVGLWNPTEKRMQSLTTFCKDEGYEYGYAELDKSERLVVKCEFKHGASGCPGVVILDDNQAYLVTMFLRGFPDFYYSRLFKGEQKERFPECKLFQQGVNIGAIYEDLKKNSTYADIFQDIFIKQNPSVNTGPSGIIQSQNYIDGNQDCHGRVSTSTRPTSIASPCGEETNESVPTCTHPTTVEKQESQMVISGQ